MTHVSNIIADFDRQQARSRAAQQKALRSAQQRAQVARAATNGLRLAFAAGAVGLLIAVVIVF